MSNAPTQLPLYPDQAFVWQVPKSMPAPGTLPKLICVDCETCDPNLKALGSGAPRRDGYVVGLAIGWDDQATYLPIAHAGGGNVENPERAIEWMRTVLADPTRTVLMANAPYDLGWLETLGLEVKGTPMDIQTVAALTDEKRRSYALNNLAYDYLREAKDESQLRAVAANWGVDPKSGLWKLPAGAVGSYAEQDARLPLKLWRKLKPVIEKQELTELLALENRVLAIAHRMHMNGVRVNTLKAEELGAELERQACVIRAEIKRLSGCHISVNSAKSVATVFQSCDLSGWTLTTTGQPSFTNEWFAMNSHVHPIVGHVHQLRQLEKLQGTFINGLISYIHKDRVYPTFNPMRSTREDDDGMKGTVTGRFSCNDPNLQQYPARTETGRMVRGLFEPEPGEHWASGDFSQQEPRLLIHYASLLNLPGAEEAKQAYINNPRTDYHQMVADLANIPRPTAKVLNLALMYGMGVPKLARTLAVDFVTAQTLYNKYYGGVPFLRGLQQACVRRVENVGYIKTFFGRRCRFEGFVPRDVQWQSPIPLAEAAKRWPGAILERYGVHKALNALIQGSAADQTKIAMVKVYDELGLVPLAQVHDELCYSIPDPELAPKIARIMEEAITLTVPSVSVAKVGRTWKETK